MTTKSGAARDPVLFGFEWEAELMGARGYVGKPFEPLELEKTIAQLLP